MIAEKLARDWVKVERAVGCLLDAAAGGDVQAAKALIPWFDQALGKPTERHEVTHPSSLEEIEQMSEQELEQLVAQGRQRRLELVEESEPAPDWRRPGVPSEAEAGP